MLNKKFRISSTKEYNNIYNNGKKIQGRYIIAFCQKNSNEYNRFGIVTSKKIGNAVARNRAKRRLRAIVNSSQHEISEGYNIVIIARYNIGNAAFENLKKDFFIIMRKAGLC